MVGGIMKTIYMTIFALGLLVSNPLYGEDVISDNNEVDAVLQKIGESANGFPPYFRDENHKKEVLDAWQNAETNLLKICSEASEDYSCQIRLGDLYRMGHNLEIKGSFEKAVSYLKKACDIEPENPVPHLLLGKHYTFGSQPVTGEQEFLEALKLSDDDNVKVDAYGGLAHSCYFQKKYKDANEYATKYLQSDPSNEVIKLIKQKSDEAMRGVFEPKLIKLK
jgi:tetratricopeptide (TPR) repeat protein